MNENMIAAKHTPGPWVVFKSDDGQILVHGDGEGVADCGPGGAEYGPVPWANARLIAAAPDLLAACKVIALNPKIVEELSTFDPKALAQVRAAVAKAKGGAK